jgi:hypothetical protein
METKKAVKMVILEDVYLQLHGSSTESFIESLRDVEKMAMEEAKLKGYVIKTVYLRDHYDAYGTGNYDIYILSEETDEEFEARLKKIESKKKSAEKRKEAKEKRELKELERLKKKYDGKQ